MREKAAPCGCRYVDLYGHEAGSLRLRSKPGGFQVCTKAQQHNPLIAWHITESIVGTGLTHRIRCSIQPPQAHLN